MVVWGSVGIRAIYVVRNPDKLVGFLLHTH